MASFYLSSHKRITKADLVQLYRVTDLSIAALDEWPVDDKQFQSKEDFVRSLNELRYAIELEGHTQRSELTDYSTFIAVMMDWLIASISVPEASHVYQELVAMQQAIEANNAFGLMRAYGAICYTTGGFRSRDDYVLFTNNQALADTKLQSAIKYSDLLGDMHKKYMTKEKVLADTISAMRLELTRNDVIENNADLRPDLERALWWFDNTTLYMDNLRLMTINVRTTIVEKMKDMNQKEVTWLVILGTTLVVIFIVSGIMVHETLELLDDYEESCTVLRDR